jgi:O-antigen/teichoic acid export membrane protein
MDRTALKAFARGSLAAIICALVAGVLNYFIRRALALNLSTTDYGFFYSAFALISIICSFADIGLTQSGAVLVARHAGRSSVNHVFSSIFTLKLILGAAGTLLLLILFKPVYHTYLSGGGTVPAYIFLALLVLLQSAENAMPPLWNGLKHFLIQNLFLTVRIFIILVLIFFLLDQYGVTAAAAAYALVPPVMLGAGLFVAHRLLGLRISFKPNRNVWKELFHLGGIMAVASTLLSITFYTDTVILTLLKGLESSGIYNMALPIMQIMSAVLVFPTIFLPFAVDMGKKGEYPALRKIARIAILLTALLLPPVYLFFHFAGEFLITVLFSAEFIRAAPAANILCCGLLFYTLGNFMLPIIISVGKARYILIIAVITAGANIGLNVVFITFMDFIGAAWATFCTHLIFGLCSIVTLEALLHRKTNEEKRH